MENENTAVGFEESEEMPMANEGESTDTADPSNEDFDGTDEGTPEAEEPKKQTARENTKYAERRREREKVSQSERDEIILETLGHKNPFTGGEMKDREDIEEYLLQKEIEKSGGDPVADLADFRKQRARAEREAKEADAAGKERMAGEIAELREKYPDTDVAELFRDEDFLDYAEGKLGKKSISEVYGAYLGFKERATGKRESSGEEMKAAQAAANQKASVGSLKSSHKESQDFYTPDQVRNMTKEEVHKNYDKIISSMKKWK